MADVLAVFAHPDDEVLGAGATLARHVREGDKVTVATLCRTRASEYQRAALTALGVHRPEAGTYPDQALDTVGMTALVSWVEWIGPVPDVVYTHSPADLNLDHELVARAVLTAFRSASGLTPRAIYGCEVPSSSEYAWKERFEPNWWVGVALGDCLAAEAAMRCYVTETRTYPHPRSAAMLTARWALRGAQIGVAKAEAFQLLRGTR